VAEGDLERAARLRGAARNLAMETGARLGSLVEEAFEEEIRPSVRKHMSDAEVERLGAEGASLTLDAAVAYALQGCPAEADHPTSP
jgi:Fe-S cluster biogenesis protein NfuA